MDDYFLRVWALRREALDHGDLRMSLICEIALSGPEALVGGEPGTEADTLAREGWTQDRARMEVCRVLTDAEARS